MLIRSTVVVLCLCAGLMAQEKKVALLAGVNEYEKPGFNNLQFAERDVEELGKELERHGFTAVVLTGSGKGDLKATRTNILAKLQTLVKPIGKGDIALVAFSGHGQQLKVKQEDGTTKEDGFFCPVDAVRETPAALVSLSFVTDEILSKNGGRSLLLIDACRDVPVSSKGIRSKGIQGREVTLPEDVAILFSCRAGQQSIESQTFKHGLFTYCVLEGLRGGAARDGEVDWDGLISHVKRRMRSREIAALIPDGSFQVPIDAGSVPYTILVPPGSPTPSKPNVPPGVSTSDRGPLKTSAGVELVLIPAGEFLMGSPDSDSDAQSDEKPQKKVKITRPFYLGKHEVTKVQFARFVAAKSYKTEAERDGKGGHGFDAATGKFRQKPEYTWRATGWTPYDDDHPVVNVSWNDAVAFCNWQSEADGLTPCYKPSGDSFVPMSGNGYRLPTEAEWEYSCRAGTTTRYSSGNGPETLAAVGNVADKTYAEKLSNASRTISASDGFAFTASVGKYKANAFGLYDMHGNVFEWCADWYDDKYSATRPESDPSGPSQGSIRVFRGGGWDFRTADCRSANRDWNTPGSRDDNLGFRLARSSVK